MRRRDLLIGSAGAVAGLAAPHVARAAERATRRFRILRDGDDIGTHTLEASLTDLGFEIEIEVDIAVRFFGITAYRYRLSNREYWKGGVIVEQRSETNDDGEDAFARIEREGDVLMIDGSGHQGEVGLDAVTTSYYAKPFLDRRPWISSQSGLPLSIEIRRTPTQPIGWNVSGELNTTLYYDEADEWVGCEFDAGGKGARYEVIESTGPIGELWARS